MLATLNRTMKTLQIYTFKKTSKRNKRIVNQNNLYRIFNRCYKIIYINMEFLKIQFESINLTSSSTSGLGMLTSNT